MEKAILEWRDAMKQLPEAKDYNKDGAVIVAYENGVVSKGYVTIKGEWAFKERHGNALFWAPYPEHPCEENVRQLNI